ncbi:CU044_5270 family protein, partial [Actinomadura harenae]
DAAPAAPPAEPAAPRRRLFGGWRLKLGVGLLAAGTAAAAVIVMTGQDGPSGKATPPLAQGGHGFTEVAAKAELAPTGRYWFSDDVSGQAYVMRPKTGAYAIFGAQTESHITTDTGAKATTTYMERDLPARPATKEDEAAWRRAGSPSSLRVWSNDHYWTYTTQAKPWSGGETDSMKGGKFYGPSGTLLSKEEFATLPTDPSALANAFFSNKGWGGHPLAPALKKKFDLKPPGKMTPRQKLFEAGGAIRNMPLPPKVRAGLMRALAAQPGIQTVKDAVDPLGRRGIALAAAPESVTWTAEYGAPKAEQGTFVGRDELVFDPKTGELLSEQTVLTTPGGAYAQLKPGTVLNYWILRQSGWTDTKPQPPADLPF